MGVHKTSTESVSEQILFQHVREQLGVALGRIRYQLLGGIIFGVIAPILLRVRFDMIPDKFANYENSIIGSLFGLLIGLMMFRKVTAIPGAGGAVNVVPAFVTSFSLVIAFFFMFRLDYSRYQFLVSFVLVVGWFYIVTFLSAKFRRVRFALVDRRLPPHLSNIRGVDWHLAPTMQESKRVSDLPLVVDFERSTLSAGWEKYLANETLSGRRVYNSRNLMEALQGRVSISRLSHNSFGHLASDSIYSPLKRYLDFIAACSALILLLPVLVPIAVFIRFDSNGPAIFRQQRVGAQGRTFTMYKFRSMKVNAADDPDGAGDKTQDNDKRITPFGAFLRRTRLDELPQIINILRGEMSWIGPRPETIKLSQWYEDDIPFYRYRHIVRPGITGWAQVKQGHVTSVSDVKDKLEYDFYYVKHFSVWLDLLILIQTFRVVITGTGAR